MLNWKSKQNKAKGSEISSSLKKSKSPETKWIKEYPNWWQYLLNILLFDRQQGCWGWLTGERSVITGSPLINRGHLGSVVRMSISTMLCLTPSTDTHVLYTHAHPPILPHKRKTSVRHVPKMAALTSKHPLQILQCRCSVVLDVQYTIPKVKISFYNQEQYPRTEI